MPSCFAAPTIPPDKSQGAALDENAADQEWVTLPLVEIRIAESDIVFNQGI